jgi:F-type H+-transporting ATPase subunit delta
MADFATVAKPYARAIFDIASASGQLAQWSEALSAVASVVSDAAALAYLGRPELSAGDRAAFVASVCADLPQAARLNTPEGRNLIELLCENDRLAALGEIAQQFDALKIAAENRVKVTLTSATPVDPDVVTRLTESLGRKLGRTVELTLEVDATLLGGAVIRAEDMVIDGSVRNRLQRLTDRLID